MKIIDKFLQHFKIDETPKVKGVASNNAVMERNVMYGKKKWYLETWFIALMFVFYKFVIPLIIGIILIVLQMLENKKITEKHIKYDDLDTTLQERQNQIAVLENKYRSKEQALNSKAEQLTTSLRNEYEYKERELEDEHQNKLKELDILYRQKLQALEENYKNEERQIELQKIELVQSLENLENEYKALTEQSTLEHYRISDYDAWTSEECKNQIALLEADITNLIQNSMAVKILSSDTKRKTNDNSKQIIRCFNAECSNVMRDISVKNIDATRNKISRSFESLNRIFNIDGVELSREFLEYKLNELNLLYTYELKKKQEKEVQDAIKEQMIEEEKVRKEIEREKSKIEKDLKQFHNEISKLTSYLRKASNETEKQLYIDKIRDLDKQISELQKRKETVLQKEANAKAGYVYIISNIGSFGENVYKIGMTRRLEPMDRIRELSSASVPFEFDVHAMIFSNDAPELESNLHKHFDDRRINLVNMRKEFFKIDIAEIEQYIKEHYNNTTQFTIFPAATEYRQTLQIANSN